MSGQLISAHDLPRSEKFGSEHLSRLAMVYIRQSTPQQVLHHQESTRMQYGLTARAAALGWPESRIIVIDDDLGRSGASIEGRTGFQRLVSEVSLNHVGIILGVEMSRLARSCKDWHHLLEVCALFGTVIADLDGIYAPGDYNDRLLLGLKGTMSEAELHIIKQRMVQGKLQKARRGELGILVPIGYVRRPSGETCFDPDEQAKHVVQLVFRKFEELGTLNAVLRFLVQQDVRLGVRAHAGASKGDLEWHRPNRATLYNMLTNPVYAGAYAYGRRAVDLRRKQPGRPSTGRTTKSAAECKVLIKDHHVAYISWEQYESNLARMAGNRARAGAVGAARNGPSLLAGLLVCGRCGSRLTVTYGGSQNRLKYRCNRRMADYGEDFCQNISGGVLDEFVSQGVLEALAPASLDLSLAAAEHLEQDRAELDRNWRQRIERAAFEAERAARQYHAVEPENRLVARQLEREWEDKLAAARALDEDYHRFERARPRLLSPDEREAIRRLAEDIPALWAGPATTNADRKAIIRHVVDKVIVATEGKSERVAVAIEWAGGLRTEGIMTRPVRKLTQLSYYSLLCERIRISEEGLDTEAIAARLNREGLRPPKRRTRFDQEAVREMMRRHGFARKPKSCQKPPSDPNEWLLGDLARLLNMPATTLYSWIAKGWLKARKDVETPRRILAWADAAEIEALQERRGRPLGYYTRRQFLAEVPGLEKGEVNNV